MKYRQLLTSLLLGLLITPQIVALQQGSPTRKVSYTTYEEAKPILEALSEAAPAELRAAQSQNLSALWSNWIARRDKAIRDRLQQGNEDSLVNFLLFGTSFTARPRITLRDLAAAGEKHLLSAGQHSPEAVAFIQLIRSRADDLVRAAAAGKIERLLFARHLLQGKGYDLRTAEGHQQARDYLLTNLARVLSEQATYARVLESARLMGDATAEFAERSKLYRTRGLSSDTSLLPNFAIETTLGQLKSRGLLAPDSVHKVGIIGPGLDFTDKQDGYDFYDEQTIQPFAVIDSLLRLGLSRADRLSLYTFDLNPRVNDHLRRAVISATGGASYTIQLPRDLNGQWKEGLIEYWEKFGERIGTPGQPAAVPAGLPDLKVRAVKVRPAIVTMISPMDTNIVLQRLELAPSERFDLLIATNILVYYDVFEQSLALTNVEAMLRPGGFLLSNNALLELPASGMHSIGYDTVIYSPKPNDGDHIVWYQRVAH